MRAAAPGRVNLIGEHTDYNGGFVLPTAIPQQTRVELTRRARSARRGAQHQRPAAAAATCSGRSSAARRLAGLRPGRHLGPARRLASRPERVRPQHQLDACRSARACRRARRWRWPACGRFARRSTSTASTTSGWRSLARRPKTTSSAPTAGSWTRWRPAWRTAAPPCSWTPAASSSDASRCRRRRPGRHPFGRGARDRRRRLQHAPRRVRRRPPDASACRNCAISASPIWPASSSCRTRSARRARHVVTEDERVLAGGPGAGGCRSGAAGRVVLRLARLDARRLRGLGAGD